MQEQTVKPWGNVGKTRGRCSAIVLILVINLFSTTTLAQTKPATISGQACAIDGDSLVIGPDGPKKNGRCSRQGIEVRVSGIDAPEWKQTCKDQDDNDWPCGQVAADRLKAMINGKHVTCQVVTRDRYKRAISVCLSGGEDVGRVMVREGMAVAYRRYSKRYVPAEDAAKAEGLGIWSGEFINPEKWRRENK